MNYISQKDLEDFMSKYPAEGDTKPESYCKSAMEMVENFLGYDPVGKTYTTVIKGKGVRLACLEAYPITEITSFKIDGVDHEVTELEIPNSKRNYIQFADDSLFKHGSKYEITYKAGYQDDNTDYIVYSEDGETFYSDSEMTHEVVIPEGVTPEATEVTHQFKYTVTKSTVPELIKNTALQIASLFWESAGGNLAVSSTSFADTGSRVFNNFKADRFLEQIAAYQRRF